MPLISVVIPAYNCASYLRETIESMLAQEGIDALEVIVVNDGSTDTTAEVARSFGPPVRLLEQANAGVSTARNHGIGQAQGDFIALSDHDDYWYPQKLAHQLAAFEAYPEVDVVFTEFKRWYAREGGQRFPAPSEFARESRSQGIDPAFSGWIYHQMLLDSWVLTSTALTRAHVFKALGGFDESLPFSEDWDFWLRASRHSQFVKLREVSTLYRQHASQGSRVLRPVDYRTQLLEKAAQRWGLCSPDGRCITHQQFWRQLARYSTAFGVAHLGNAKGADRRIALRALLKAWTIDPTYWRSLAYLTLMPLGWKPSESDQSS